MTRCRKLLELGDAAWHIADMDGVMSGIEKSEARKRHKARTANAFESLESIHYELSFCTSEVIRVRILHGGEFNGGVHH